MKVILCADDEMREWHIRSGVGLDTYCGKRGDRLPTDPMELPTDEKYLCKACLAKVRSEK